MQVTISVPTKGLDVRYLPQLNKIQFKLSETNARALMQGLYEILRMERQRSFNELREELEVPKQTG